MPHPDPHPAPRQRAAEPPSPAWTDALAAALSAHRTLARGLGRSVPLTALCADGGASGLAAFVAVYAAQQDGTAEPDSDLGEAA